MNEIDYNKKYDKTSTHHIKTPEELLGIDPKNNSSQVKKTIGKSLLLLLALNFIFDSSIFYVSQMGLEISGPFSIISWIVVCILAVYIAMCFGEVISIFPTSGGIYEISKRAYGSYWSFIVGITTWFAGCFALIVSIPAGLELLIPYYTPGAYIIKFFVSVFTIVLFSHLAYKGGDLSNKLFVFFTYLILLCTIILLITTFFDFSSVSTGEMSFALDFSNYIPFFHHEGFLSNFGAFLATIFILSTIFFGLEAVTFLSEQVIDAPKVMPKVIVKSMIIVCVVMFIFVFGSFAVLNQQTYIDSYVFYEDLMFQNLGPGGWFLTLLVFILSGMIYFSEGLGWIIAGPYLIFSFARDRLFPTSFSKLDEKTNTPLRAIKFQLFFLIIALIVNYYYYIFTEEDPFYLFHELWLFFAFPVLILLVLSVPILRKKYPELTRHYTAPFGNFLPYFVAAFLIVVIIGWIIFEEGYHALILYIIALLIATPIYFILSLYFDPDVYINFKKKVSKWGLIYERLAYRREIRSLLYGTVGDLKGKRVLLFGGGFGFISMHLAEHIGKSGKLHIIDVSPKSIKMINVQAKRLGHDHVITIQDEHQINRIHPSIPQVDIILSLGMLHHVQDLKKILSEMSSRLPEGGKIIFKDEIDILKIVPNGGWASDPDKVIKLLQEQGFIVQKHVRPGLFFNHLFIYAMKSKYAVPMI